MFELIIVSLFAVLWWGLAFSKSTRTKMPTPWWIKAIQKEEEEQRALADILLRTIGFAGGIMFSLWAIVVLMQKLR